MNNIKISIIVPIYKVPEKYLKKCIESLINQTLKDIEILLVDDGSPDDCGKICDSYAKENDIIKVLHKKNGGLSSARNTGFISAIGEYIMFVDGDDWIESNMCEEMYQTAKNNNTQLIMCGIVKDFEHSSSEYKFYLEENKIYSNEECKWLQQQLLVYNANIAVAYSKLIDRNLLLKYNILHDEQLRQGAEGLEFNLRLFEHLESAIFINKPFYHYIYNENSISASHNEENHRYVIKCFKKIQNLIQQSSNKEQLMPWFYNRLLYVVITTAISGYFNPVNTEPFNVKKKKYTEYLQIPIIQQALQSPNRDGLSKQRKIILFMIEHKMFISLNIMGKIRKWQKKYM